MYLRIKYFFDKIIAFLLVIIFLPFLFIIMLLIRFGDSGSAFYFQKRVGQHGKVFKIIKFRTMKNDSENLLLTMLKDNKIRNEWYENYKLKEDPRVTKIGKVLRYYSLDELPQLINVLKGDMSIIGPRPVVIDELQKYGKYKQTILKLKPGITGWWACNVTPFTTYNERIQLEYYYAKNVSFHLDIKCFVRTVYTLVFQRKNKDRSKI